MTILISLHTQFKHHPQGIDICFAHDAWKLASKLGDIDMNQNGLLKKIPRESN